MIESGPYNNKTWVDTQTPQHVYGTRPVTPPSARTEEQLRAWEADQAEKYKVASAFALRQKRWNEMKILEPLSVLVQREVFDEVIAWFLANERLEVAGLGLVREEEGRIPRFVWGKLDATATGSGGSVSSNTASLVAECVVANGAGPNVQLHTHPGMGTFYSGTDQQDIMATIDRAPNAGHMYFLVLDQLDWQCRRIHWNGDKTELSYHPVTMWVADTSIKLEFRRKAEQAASPAAYASRRGNYYSTTEAANTDYDDYGLYDKSPSEATARAYRLALKDNDTPLRNVTQANASLYMGAWSDKPADYNYLFDLFDVAKYDWIELQDCLEKLYGSDIYTTIIEAPELWEYLGEEELHGQELNEIETE